MVLVILNLILLSVFILIIAIDILPNIRDWVSRLKIGRYKNYEQWCSRITEKGVEWLVKTPKVRLTDQTRLLIIDKIKGNYTKPAIQHWQEGALLLGLTEYLKYNKDNSINNFILKYLDQKFTQDGQWREKPKNIDAAILAYAVIKLDFIDSNRYKKAFDYIWEVIKEHIGQDGTVFYRHTTKNYRYVDTIGFICPFLVSYGKKYGIEDCIELAVKQIKYYERYGMHKDYDIPVHAYHIESKMPLGIYGWGRGLGWFGIGLIDSWSEILPEHKYKNELEKSVIRFAEAIKKYQQEDGSWKWTVTRSETRKDSSVTATLSWFLLRVAEFGIGERSEEQAIRAIQYLMTVTRRSGAVDFSQGDTKDIGDYSTLFNILPFTQGFCIRTINCYIHTLKERQRQKVG